MPVYEARCPGCGTTAEYLRSVAECLDTPDCPECAVRMDKVVLSAPLSYVTGRFEAFRSSVDGSIIRNQRDMLEHNKRNNVVNIADGYSDDAVRNGNFRKPKEAKLDKKELADDIGAAILKVRDGYRPEVQYDDA